MIQQLSARLVGFLDDFEKEIVELIYEFTDTSRFLSPLRHHRIGGPSIHIQDLTHSFNFKMI